MILTEEMIKKLPVLTEEQEREAELVEANYEEDLKEMLEQFNKEVEKIDRLYESVKYFSC